MGSPTYPDDFKFQDLGGAIPTGQSMPLEEGPLVTPPDEQRARGYPEPIIKITDEQKDLFLIWLDEWLQWLINDQAKKQETWARHEDAYRGLAP